MIENLYEEREYSKLDIILFSFWNGKTLLLIKIFKVKNTK